MEDELTVGCEENNFQYDHGSEESLRISRIRSISAQYDRHRGVHQVFAVTEGWVFGFEKVLRFLKELVQLAELQRTHSLDRREVLHDGIVRQHRNPLL
eukprot:3312493-Rhodomonas_salina.2